MLGRRTPARHDRAGSSPSGARRVPTPCSTRQMPMCSEPAVASESASLPTRPVRTRRRRPSRAAMSSALLAVTIWLAGTVAGAGVLLVGLARLRWLRASRRPSTQRRVEPRDGWAVASPVRRASSRSCDPPRRGVDLLFGPRPGLVATWGWRRPAGRGMLPAAASEWSTRGGADARACCCTSWRTFATATGCCRWRPKRCAASGGSTRWRGWSVPGCAARASTRPTTLRRPARGVERFKTTQWADYLRDASRRTCEGGSETSGCGGRGCRRRRWRVRLTWNGGCPPC